MPESIVQLTLTDGVARITLNRPAKRNALSRELIRQIAAAVEQAAGDPSLRVLVLAAEGTVFCAGMDLAEMQSRAGQPGAEREWAEDTRVYRDLLLRIVRLPVPTVALVQGPALAGGLGLVLACDLVVASEQATFALPEPKRGITAAVVLPLLLYRVGLGPANQLLLSGETWTAPRALQAGLCHEVVAGGGLDERGCALVRSILSGAPSSLAVTKQHLQDCAARDLERQLESGMRLSAEARATSDAREGLAAFLEKRLPAWSPNQE